MRDTPTTDPAAARQLAMTLRDSAERVHELAIRLDHHTDALRFEGPAALRLRATMAERKLRAMAISNELRELAHTHEQHC
jgi:hypothetical protein